MLNKLDRELVRRGHRFVRYADDCMIFCKSRKSAERTFRNIIPFIEEKLFLKVNRNKTGVAHISKVKYLGYTFYRYIDGTVCTLKKNISLRVVMLYIYGVTKGGLKIIGYELFSNSEMKRRETEELKNRQQKNSLKQL